MDCIISIVNSPVFLVLRITFPAILFYLGYKYGTENILILVIVAALLVLFAIMTLILYFVNMISKRELFNAQLRLDATSGVSQIRINNWYDLYGRITQKRVEKIDQTFFDISDKKYLNTRDSIKKVVSILGLHLKSILIPYSKRDASLMVSYLQTHSTGEGVTLRFDKNFYCSNKNRVFSKSFFEQLHFISGDGSTAGHAIATGEPVYISDVKSELADPTMEPRYKPLGAEDDTKSIACFPISYKELFFGVLCISCNQSVIKENESFIFWMEQALKPVVKQLILIELVKTVKSAYSSKCSAFFDFYKEKHPDMFD